MNSTGFQASADFLSVGETGIETQENGHLTQHSDGLGLTRRKQPWALTPSFSTHSPTVSQLVFMELNRVE